MIPQKKVQEILDTAKVEEVIQDFVSLRRRGVNLIGVCPFHNEKTPSFTVSPSKNIFKCFGCGKGGDPARFIMEHEHLSYPDALRYLARKYRIEIEEIQMTPEAVQQQQEEASLQIVNEHAQQFFQTQLFDTDMGRSVGLNYFKERGFREETIRKFGLGYAPNEADAFTRQAVAAGFKPDFLKRLGLTSQQNRDFFRNRVMFTIHNLSGKPIAFAGRILEKDLKAPKYVNSPETEIYTKNKILYGAFFAKTAIRKQDECILVEGYTDVISLYQAGFENVVASSGTSLTEGQIALIKRFTPNIKILYDGDPAGVKAALRGLDMVLERDMNVKIVLIPDGDDPDSYLQKVGAAAFREFVDSQGKDFILFKTSLLLQEVKGDPVKKAGLVRDIVDTIAKIPDPFKRSFYIKECARVMELDELTLVTETNKSVKLILQKKETERQRGQGVQLHIVPEDSDAEFPAEPGTPEAAPRSREVQPQVGDHEFQERDIARILVASGGEIYDPVEKITIAEFILGNIEEVLEEFDNATYQRIAKECLQMVVNHQPVSPQYFIGHADRSISELAIDLLHSVYEYSFLLWDKKADNPLRQKMPDENYVEDGMNLLLRFKYHKLSRMISLNQEKLKSTSSEAPEYFDILKVQMKLKTISVDIAQKLGMEVNSRKFQQW